MRFIIIVLIIEILLIFGSLGADIEKITPWLLGINFTLAIFSINFTFFGYQLSKYKPIYNKVSKRQWINLIILMVLPFAPIVTFLMVPNYFGLVALWMLPILMFSAIDNSLLTSKYLNPKTFLTENFTDKIIKKYLSEIAKVVKSEVSRDERYRKLGEKIQIPPHGLAFEPSVLGRKENDLWDSISMITKLSIENNDYPVFKKSISTTIKLLLASYSYEKGKNESYKITSGIKTISQRRLRSIIGLIEDKDGKGIFFRSLTNELCEFATLEETLNQPLSDISTSVASNLTWIGNKILESGSDTEPQKILNTLHLVAELTVHKLETEKSDDPEYHTHKYNVANYANLIKSLGVTSLENNNAHFAYRCMESLSYLGCNAAQLQSKKTVEVVLASIVQLARVARNKNIGCFWDHCLIPLEGHAEENVGHILTWLIQDIDEKGDFFMKGYIEQAYSRIRGYVCNIKPTNSEHPRFWVKQAEDNGKQIPHVERFSGMYGYGGELDYSDFSNLKEYELSGSVGSMSYTIMSPPTPIEVVDS